MEHYRFNAPEHHTITVQGKTYKGGDVLECDPAVAESDLRLEKVRAKVSEPVDGTAGQEGPQPVGEEGVQGETVGQKGKGKTS